MRRRYLYPLRWVLGRLAVVLEAIARRLWSWHYRVERWMYPPAPFNITTGQWDELLSGLYAEPFAKMDVGRSPLYDALKKPMTLKPGMVRRYPVGEP